MGLRTLFAGAVTKTRTRLIWTLVREMSGLSPGVGLGFVGIPCCLFSARPAAEVCAVVCNRHRELGDLSSVPALTASF